MSASARPVIGSEPFRPRSAAYLAGMHTTVNQIALGLHALLRHRDQWERLRSEPSLLENAVEELLRFEPTAQYMRSSNFIRGPQELVLRLRP